MPGCRQQLVEKNWLGEHPGQLSGPAAPAGSGSQVPGEKVSVLSTVLDGQVCMWAQPVDKIQYDPAFHGTQMQS